MVTRGLWWLLACTGGSPDTKDTHAVDTADDTGTTGDSVEVLDDTGGGTTTDTDADAEYAAFFDDSVVGRVDLELDEEARAALAVDPETYVRGAFTFDGERLADVGVRFDGADALTQTVDGKPSFRIKLREFDDLQWAGLDRIELHNFESDATQMREVLASQVLRSAGFPAARANFVEVWLDGESLGLYANVEVIDDAFLARRWDDPSGDLWKAGDAADFTPAGQDDFELVSGYGDTDALDAARRQIQLGEGPFYDVADQVVDMDGFLDLWAWQVLMANADGYPFTLDDFYLYADPDDSDRYSLLAASLDETWDAGIDVEATPGTLAVHCRYDDACAALLAEHMVTALAAWDSADVAGIAADDVALTELSVNDDPRRTLPAADVVTARGELEAFLVTWPETFRTE